MTLLTVVFLKCPIWKCYTMRWPISLVPVQRFCKTTTQTWRGCELCRRALGRRRRHLQRHLGRPAVVGERAARAAAAPHLAVSAAADQPVQLVRAAAKLELRALLQRRASEHTSLARSVGRGVGRADVGGARARAEVAHAQERAVRRRRRRLAGPPRAAPRARHRAVGAHVAHASCVRYAQQLLENVGAAGSDMGSGGISRPRAACNRTC